MFDAKDGRQVVEERREQACHEGEEEDES